MIYSRALGISRKDLRNLVDKHFPRNPKLKEIFYRDKLKEIYRKILNAEGREKYNFPANAESHLDQYRL